MRIYPIFLALIILGCSGTKPESPAAVEVPAAVDPAVDAQRRASGFVVKNADNIVEYAMRFAKSDDLSHEIQSILDRPADVKKTGKGGKNAPQDESAPIGFLQPEDLKSFYASRGYAPIFIESGRISPRMKPLEDELMHMAAHGLKIDADAWRKSREALAGAWGAGEPEFKLTPAEKTAVIDIIVRDGVDIRDGRAVRGMIAGLVGENTPIPRLRKAVMARAETMTAVARHAARTELLTADLAIRFARAMALDNMAHLTKEEKDLLGRKPTDKKYRRIAEMRAMRWLGEAARIADLSLPGVRTGKAPENTAENQAADEKTVQKVRMADGATADADAAQVEAASAQEAKLLAIETIDELAAALYPAHPGYKDLMAARQRYLEMPDWKDVPRRRKMTAGRSYENVPALKERLAAEGYYHGEILPEEMRTEEYSVYDNELRAAVRVYYDTHQLAYDEAEGFLGGFWSSLNTPRAKRIAQIEENLRRWHKTQIIESPYYIFINVPDFHGEIWRDGKMTYRFPIVAGNAKRQCDAETKRWKYINATPLMHARMLYVEYNPYWNVPPRIEQEDYIEKINADPTWLETHGFEYFTEDGYTVLRQLPSEKNALGRVKFIFPNPHSTFMHDTPNKGMFRYPIRAFSHGCMRVAEPLELAKRIMQYDGQWYDALAEEIEDYQMRRFVLKTRFDVFIDYFTVTVSSDGMVHFLADPYRYVRDALDPPKARSLECVPEKKTWISRTALDSSRPQEEDVGAEVMGL